MKNKKGVTIGRILLYILFISLLGFFIYIIACTFKAIKEKQPTNIDTNEVIKKVNDNSTIINLYDKASYPFVGITYQGATSTTHAQTGCFIWVNPGTYSASVDSSLTSLYNWAVTGSSIPTFDRQYYTTFDTSWVNGSSTSFTLTSGCYLSFYIMKKNNSTIDYDFLNSLDYMINEGSVHSYVPYTNDFVNALDYISNAYFEGSASFTINNFYDQGNNTASVYGFYPVVSSTDERSTYKTTYNKSVINHNDLIIGDNIESLYTSINNSSYSGFYYTYSYSFNYNNDTNFINVYYECSSPIPINYFNFTFNGSDILSNSNTGLFVNANDNISIYTTFNNNNKFTYQDLLNVNPNISRIYSFGFTIFNSSSQSTVGIQNKSWTSYSSFCNFHIAFDNFYGNSIWQDGYDSGFLAGQLAADEGLVNSNASLQESVNVLSSQVSELTSRVNQQSDIITQLNNQLQQSNNNFKGLFFTFADIPFKTVSNALGFEFWGVNLFRFFVGIITALGIVWLIKRIL